MQFSALQPIQKNTIEIGPGEQFLTENGERKIIKFSHIFFNLSVQVSTVSLIISVSDVASISIVYLKKVNCS